MITFVNKRLTFFQYLRWRHANKQGNRFFAKFSSRAQKYIESYPSKYLACFAFDGDTARILTHGSPEKEELDCVFQYLEENNHIQGCALDVGANYGMHSLRFANHFEHVYAFEPHPAVFPILSFNMQHNNLQKNVSAYNYGLSSEEQTLTLYDHKGRNIGGSTFEAQHVQNKDTPYKFECILKSLDQEKDIRSKKVGLVKIDVEGHELSVLKGAQDFIKEQHPVILMEDWVSSQTQESDAIKFLKELGYKHFLVPTSYPIKRPSHNKLDAMINNVRFLIALLFKGQKQGLGPYDFSSTNGYDLIIAHV